MLQVGILDDYAGLALESADWAQLDGLAEITVLREHVPATEIAARLGRFDVLCTMRERMAMPRAFFGALPRLKLVTIVGRSLGNLDAEAATEHGVAVVHPGFDFGGPEAARSVHATPELAWGLVLSAVRHIAAEDRRVRQGLWQGTVGTILHGRTLGLLGLGNAGRLVAGYGAAFGMEVIAWSQNLTDEAAQAGGATRVERDALFARSDVLSIHLQLSERTRGLVGAPELARMKPGAVLINTSRGPIVDEAALVRALSDGMLGGAGLDVFGEEPMPADHPLCCLPNVTLTPHLGYATREIMRLFYSDMPEAVAAFARGAPSRVVNPAALTHPRHAR